MSSDATLRRWATAAVVLVAVIAATVSYLHVYRLSLALGQPQLAALLMPLSVDGSVGAASAALLAAARLGNKTPRMAQGMLTLGVLATLAANAYSGLGHGIAGMVLACWPAVAFIGSTEVALGMARGATKAVSDADPVPAIETANVAAIESATPRPPKRTAKAAKLVSRGRKAAAIVAKQPGISGAELAAKLGVSERTGRRILTGLEVPT